MNLLKIFKKFSDLKRIRGAITFQRYKPMINGIFGIIIKIGTIKSYKARQFYE